jgi:hypothetical protein
MKWYRHGQLYRLGKPAIVGTNWRGERFVEYWYNGRQVSKHEALQRKLNIDKWISDHIMPIIMDPRRLSGKRLVTMGWVGAAMGADETMGAVGAVRAI